MGETQYIRGGLANEVTKITKIILLDISLI